MIRRTLLVLLIMVMGLCLRTYATNDASEKTEKLQVEIEKLKMELAEAQSFSIHSPKEKNSQYIFKGLRFISTYSDSHTPFFRMGFDTDPKSKAATQTDESGIDFQIPFSVGLFRTRSLLGPLYHTELIRASYLWGEGSLFAYAGESVSVWVSKNMEIGIELNLGGKWQNPVVKPYYESSVFFSLLI